MRLTRAGSPVFAVLGAGNGGTALAGYLALQGYRVHLYNRSAERLEPLQQLGGVWVDGAVRGFAPIPVVTWDIAEAIEGADILLVTVPASGHRDLTYELIPHLSPGQILILNPGRTGGALEVGHILEAVGLPNLVAEAQTFVFASRVTGPGEVRIFEIKREVPVAAFPSCRTLEILARLGHALPQFVLAPSLLHTSLENIGAIFHPAPLLLNAGRVESGIAFDYYGEGITPVVASFMEAVDHERLAVATSLGVRVHSAKEWLARSYGSTGGTLYSALQATHAYQGIKAPGTLNHRYIWEDVPTGLVALASFAELGRVRVPKIRALIELASGIHGIDYVASGRSLQRMGLEGLALPDLAGYLEYRERPRRIRPRRTFSFRPLVRPISRQESV